MEQAGKTIIIAGIVLLIIGLSIYCFGNKFIPITIGRLGNLPGDIKIEKDNFKLYFPLTTMILLSVVLTIILWIIRKFLN